MGGPSGDPAAAPAQTLKKLSVGSRHTQLGTQAKRCVVENEVDAALRLEFDMESGCTICIQKFGHCPLTSCGWETQERKGSIADLVVVAAIAVVCWKTDYHGDNPLMMFISLNH